MRVQFCCAAAMAAFAAVAGAQTIPHYLEYRGDAIITRGAAAEVGIGEVFPAGVYMRFSVDGAAGATWIHGSTEASGRVDAIGRFLLDPFRETPVALSMGGGVSVPYAAGDPHVRPYLTAVIDIEGRRRGGVTPAVQIGLGGGARIGVVLRQSPLRYR